MEDPFELSRFLDAQDRDATFERALGELRSGRKQSHWMWFVFPQLLGLGRSGQARRYGIASLAEARAYLAHPVLGARLRRCAEALLSLDPVSPVEVLGEIDAVKLRSSMTLFDRVEPGGLFGEVLEAFYGGVRDPATEDLLEAG